MKIFQRSGLGAGLLLLLCTLSGLSSIRPAEARTSQAKAIVSSRTMQPMSLVLPLLIPGVAVKAERGHIKKKDIDSVTSDTIRKLEETAADIVPEDIVETDSYYRSSSSRSRSRSGSGKDYDCGHMGTKCCHGIKGHAPCQPGTGCKYDLTPDVNGTLDDPICTAECGDKDQPCCQSICGDDCSCECKDGTDFDIVTKTCQPCGNPTQRCCEGDSCIFGHVCLAASKICVPCGGDMDNYDPADPQAACEDGCAAGFVSQAGLCEKCGHELGAPCCKSKIKSDDTCTEETTSSCQDGLGLRCAGTGLCVCKDGFVPSEDVVGTCVKTKTSSESPSSAPSSDPSSPPQSSPSSDSSSSPSSLPSLDPSSEPSETPSETPSSLPSLQPSGSPSEMPSSDPSSQPSLHPSSGPTPADECDLVVVTECSTQAPTESGDGNCNAISPIKTRCEQRATEMVMLFNGGDCDQSCTIQDEGQFDCIDFNGGPGISGPYWIHVKAQKKDDIVYHSDFVHVGDVFPMCPGYPTCSGDRLEADTTVFIFNGNPGGDPVNNPAAPLVQLVDFHSSCSRTNFLKDKYGSTQLVAFFNAAQGLVSCFITATFTITLTNEGEEFAEITSFTNTVNGNTTNLIDAVLVPTVQPGDQVTITTQTTIDMTVRQDYTVTTQIVGETAGGRECSDSNTFNFTAGNDFDCGAPG